MASPLPAPPTTAPALWHLGALARMAGEPARAVDLLEGAVALDMGLAGAWAELGLALLALGRFSEGCARLRRALFLDARLPAARNALGLELLRRGHPALAVAEFAAATELQPAEWSLQHNLGLAQQHQGDLHAAADAFAEAVRLAPAEPTCRHALATALHQCGRTAEAVPLYREALALRPDWPEALGNLGCALRALGQPEQALAQYDAALTLAPDFATARWNRALALLSLGRLEQAWEDHEARWQVPGFPSPPRGFAPPLWHGEDIAGGDILLHAEQGFGDAIQALRYVPMVAARGARVLLEVPRELLRLARRLPGPAQVIPRGETLPAFECHAPLMSLPRAFGTTLATIPCDGPYLSVPEAEIAAWRARLATLPGPRGARRVGLVWAGRPTHGNDSCRSMRLADLTPLLDLPGLRLVSLQVGPRAAEAAAHPTVADLSAELHDFADTAAALMALDALVAVDTSAVHLAGALGRPAHVLLPFAPDWRWLLGRADSPWYPSLRLHRQSAAGDWRGPLASVTAALRALASSDQPWAA